MSIAHPDAALEKRHFEEALGVIAQELEGARERKSDAYTALELARRMDPDNLPVREMQFALAEQNERSLHLAEKKPYFTRVDFREENADLKSYYIGKNGVVRAKTLEPYIIDWRAPVANLYYSGQIGPMEYTAPEGVVRGEMTLKRQFGVDDGQLKTIFDSGIAAQDEYLQSVLGAVTGERLTEIVTTIQAEQNAIIRHPLKRSLVVQGVAGSGKTSIALHRIAFLLYTYQDRLFAENTLILAPNPMFLQYIAPVLPDLGVERVRQTTFTALLQAHLGKGMPPLKRPATGFARIKGSMETVQLLDKWLDDYETRILPENGFSFGPIVLYSAEELRQFILVDEKPFPMERRIAELKKHLSSRVKSAEAKICQWYRMETQKRAAKFKNEPEKVKKLYDQLDERIQAANEKAKTYVKDALKEMGDFSPLRLYRLFWEDMEKSEDGELRACAKQELAAKGKTASGEDAALLALIAFRTAELPRMTFRHIVVDEAQDMRPADFYILRRLNPAATFTIVGDMMQGVSQDSGLESWDELREVFSGDIDRNDLVTSYRSTVEIIELAKRVWQNAPVPVEAEIQPVLRHGDAPLIEHTKNAAARIAQQLEEWKHLPSVAVITRTEKEADALVKKLPDYVRRLDIQGEEYHAGVVVGSAASVKGLEFDGVILADASANVYGETMADAKLLYVALTRALHRMCVFHTGEITPLLKR